MTVIVRDSARRAALAVRCPHCGATPGARCTVPSSGRPLAAGAHPSRSVAAVGETEPPAGFGVAS